MRATGLLLSHAVRFHSLPRFWSATSDQSMSIARRLRAGGRSVERIYVGNLAAALLVGCEWPASGASVHGHFHPMRNPLRCSFFQMVTSSSTFLPVASAPTLLVASAAAMTIVHVFNLCGGMLPELGCDELGWHGVEAENQGNRRIAQRRIRLRNSSAAQVLHRLQRRRPQGASAPAGAPARVGGTRRETVWRVLRATPPTLATWQHIGQMRVPGSACGAHGATRRRKATMQRVIA